MPLTKTEIDILLKAQADLTAFKTAKGEMAGIRAEVSKSNEAFKSFGSVARSALGTLGVGISVGAIASGIKSVIDYGSKINDLATQSGTSTDAFQVLALAGKQAGVEFDQTARSLEFLRKTISDTAAGTGEAKEAFRALKLDARELSQLPLERALEEVAIAVAKSEDQTTAYGYALDILGSKNIPKLQEVLKNLAEDGFDKVSESMRGMVLTKEQLKLLDDAGDKLTAANAKWQVFKASLLQGVDQTRRDFEKNPVIETLKNLAIPGGAAFADIFSSAARALRGFDEAGKGASQSINEAAYATEDLASETSLAASAGEKLLTIAEKDKLAREASAAAAKELAEIEKFAADYIAERNKMNEERAAETLTLNEKLARLGEQQRKFDLDQLSTFEKHAALSMELVALQAELGEVVGIDNPAFAKRLAYEERILEVRREIAGINTGLTSSLDSFFGNLDAASASMEMFKKETKETKDIAKELGNTFSSAFENAIVRGGKLRDVVRGLLQDILQLFVRQQISAPIASFFGDFFKGIFGGGKALGGPVDAGTAYVVGERGPELFVPNVAGEIVPNRIAADAAASGDGGDVFQFTQNFMGGVTRGELAEMIPQIVSASKNAVLDAKRRRQPGFA